MGLPNIGPVELIIVLVIALLVLGPGKLPEVGSAFGKTIREFRKASSDIQDTATLTPAPATRDAAAARPVSAAAPAAEPAPAAAAEAPRGTPADPVEDPS